MSISIFYLLDASFISAEKVRWSLLSVRSAGKIKQSIWKCSCKKSFIFLKQITFFSNEIIFHVFFHTNKVEYSYIEGVSFIGVGNRSTRRKPPTCASHWQSLSHVVSSTPRLGGIRTHNFSVELSSIVKSSAILCVCPPNSQCFWHCHDLLNIYLLLKLTVSKWCNYCFYDKGHICMREENISFYDKGHICMREENISLYDKGHICMRKENISFSSSLFLKCITCNLN
jgi:hypothetical protein